jgi:hypothetical protein
MERRRQRMLPRERLEAQRAADDWLWRRLLGNPTQAECRPSLATVEDGTRGPAKHSLARTSVSRTCARGKGRRGHAP